MSNMGQEVFVLMSNIVQVQLGVEKTEEKVERSGEMEEG